MQKMYLEAEAGGTQTRPLVLSTMPYCSAHPTYDANPHPLPLYLAEVMAIICVVASALISKQGYHLSLARIPVKPFTLYLPAARLESKNS